ASIIFDTQCINHNISRTDELYHATLNLYSEVRLLGQKTVAVINGVDVAHFRGAHDPIDLQITFRARRRADANCFVGKLHEQRIDVRVRINRKRANAELLARANDAQRNLTAIGNQDLFEHPLLPRNRRAALNQRTRKRTWPNWTGLLLSATTSA